MAFSSPEFLTAARGSSGRIPALLGILFGLLALLAPTSSVQSKPAGSSMKIQSVKSPGGVEAWLVEEHSVPLLALRFVFDGGNSQDPLGKEGVANFISAMLDEGAGEYDHTQFQERMEDLALKMSFEDGRDAFYGSFETLTANRAPSIEMLRLAINKPRFETEAVDRIRKQLLASLSFAAKSPDKVASKAWSAAAFPGHPYGRPSEGTIESVKSITRDDLEAYRRRIFARDTLRVVAVGDIDAQTLGLLLDQVFGGLPAKAELVPVADTTPKPTEKLQVIDMNVPQSVVQFGMNGIPRKDKDFLPAYVLNQILGGGGFASRLTEEVREKRGLAYSVYSYLQPFRHVALFGGGVATKNEEVGRSLDVIRAELKRMADEGPTPTELANAKSYLTGSFALRFDTNSKIANQLLWMLQEDMGIDYVEKRNALVEAVTLDDVKRVAKRLLKVDDLIVTVVGKPKGLATKG
jgi:zinc protease